MNYPNSKIRQTTANHSCIPSQLEFSDDVSQEVTEETERSDETNSVSSLSSCAIHSETIDLKPIAGAAGIVE